MDFELSRAHRRFLGLTGRARQRSELEMQPLATIRLLPSAKTFLRRQLDAPGVYRSGPLFGRSHEGVLTVAYAAPAGYARWLRETASCPLALQEDYVLGWIDALRVADTESPPLDWVGQWLTFPDCELRGTDEELMWLRRARESRLVDDRHCLLFSGWQDERASLRSYIYHSDVGGRGLDELV